MSDATRHTPRLYVGPPLDPLEALDEQLRAERVRMHAAWLEAELAIEDAVDDYHVRAAIAIDSGEAWPEPTADELAVMTARIARERLLRHAMRRPSA
jgi:hypothetical protein